MAEQSNLGRRWTRYVRECVLISGLKPSVVDCSHTQMVPAAGFGYAFNSVEGGKTELEESMARAVSSRASHRPDRKQLFLVVSYQRPAIPADKCALITMLRSLLSIRA